MRFFRQFILHPFDRASCTQVFTKAFGHQPPSPSKLFSTRFEDIWWAWLPGFPGEEPPLPRWIVEKERE